ncbi:MAG: hypothetical protein HY908_07040 [Myxococcales bacterium]|nr:hypothetical protein [Myxococcales bacterium]
MNHVLHHAYQDEYRFVRREKAHFVLPNVSGGPNGLSLSAMFGRCPAELPHLEDNYREAFEPDEGLLEGAALFDKLRQGTPLKVTNWGLDARRPGLHDLCFFLMGASGADVIDYWNLRALGWRLLPVPLAWAEPLINAARETLRRESDGYEERTVSGRFPAMMLAARSVARSITADVAHAIQNGDRYILPVQTWYPSLWTHRTHSYELERCVLSALEDEHEQPLQGEMQQHWVSVPPLAPPFRTSTAFGAGAQWATVISIRSDAAIPVTPAVVPTGIERAAALFGPGTKTGAVVMGEGVVVYAGDRAAQLLRVPATLDVAAAWFAAQGYGCSVSAPGRIALAIVRSLGGLLATRRIAKRALLETLNSMAHGGANGPSLDVGGLRPRRQTRPKVESHGALLGALKQLNDNNVGVARRHLRALLDCGVFRIGLELSCPECTQTTWFSLGALSDRVRCERCLHDFQFPADAPPRGEAWTYRAQGAFSIENYAQGSYAVVLALRLFALHFHDRDFAWIPSAVLKDRTGKDVEVDFAIWRRDPSGSDVRLVVGEAKSFGDFGPKDFENARAIMRAFPGAFLVFATLKTELNPRERQRLRALARLGRGTVDGRGWRSPVIVITGREILHEWGPPMCWHGQAGAFVRAARICKPGTDLLSLAQATQLAYLDLEPDEHALRATRSVRGDKAAGASRPRKRRNATRGPGSTLPRT